MWSTLGAYCWGGQLTAHPGQQGFEDTVAAMLKLGFRTIRFAATPVSAMDYGMALPKGADRNLGAVVGEMLSSPVWDHPALERVMITAHDFAIYDATGSNDGYCSTAVIAAHRVAALAEYARMFEVLAKRFAGRAIDIVLSNWEGDNLVYGGNAYGFSQQRATADHISGAWPKGHSNASRLAGVINWFALKDAAVAAAQSIPHRGKIIHAPEFNILHSFDAGCGGACAGARDTVLGAMSAQGGRPYASYSSYESQDHGYIADVEKIHASWIGKLIIGEAGYDLKKTAPAKERTLFAELDALRSYGVRTGRVLGIIPWNAVSPADDRQRFGMLGADGHREAIDFLGKLAPGAAH